MNHAPHTPLPTETTPNPTLSELRQAVQPYLDRAAPHEQLWDADDYRNHQRLTAAMASSRTKETP